MALLPRTKTEPPQQPAPEPPATIPLPALPELQTIDQVHAALAALDARRVEFQRILDTEKQEETALLDRDAPDQDFSRLDMRVRNARRQFYKLDREEGRILARAREIEQGRRDLRWLELRALYVDAARRLKSSAEQTDRLQREVQGIVDAAGRENMTGLPPAVFADYFIPWPVFSVPFNSIPMLAHTAPPVLTSYGVGVTEVVEFIKPFGTSEAGSMEAMPAERAKWLVEQGVAVIQGDGTWGTVPPLDHRTHPSDPEDVPVIIEGNA